MDPLQTAMLLDFAAVISDQIQDISIHNL